MDTGVISIIMNLLPWQFKGLGVLATIMFVWNIVLFSCFALLSIARFFKYNGHIKSEHANNMEQMSYLAAPAIAYLTIVAQVSLTCSTAWGYNFTILAYAMWWFGLVWTVSICSWSVIYLAKHDLTQYRDLSPAVFFPLIGTITQGTVGGLLVNYSYGLSATLAIPVVVVSFMLIGYSFFLAIMYYTMYINRLLAVGIPANAKIPSMVVTIGPIGQFATAMQLLGTAADSGKLFAQYNKGTFLTALSASTLSTICVLLSLLVLGFGFLWM
jgi:tellurite resistance protein TehA-like permease